MVTPTPSHIVRSVLAAASAASALATPPSVQRGETRSEAETQT